MVNDPHFAVAVVGLKGQVFLRGLISGGCPPTDVFSYAQSSDMSDGFLVIQKMCAEAGIRFSETKNPKICSSLRLFFVGWQFLYKGELENAVVFHDSLLPKYRGFAPTVAALISGEKRIGVTAFRPEPEGDTGRVYQQAAEEIVHPIKIAEALELQANLMAGIALDIVERDRQGAEHELEIQDEEHATYSIWRDNEDFFLDLHQPADKVVRTVYALGPPYTGAKVRYDNNDVTVLNARVVEDLDFVERHVGKIWQLNDGCPSIICGKGLVQFTEMLDGTGKLVKLRTLRSRFS